MTHHALILAAVLASATSLAAGRDQAVDEIGRALGIGPLTAVGRGAGTAAEAPVPARLSKPIEPAMPLETDAPRNGRALGEDDAPVTMQVWIDYQCPGCARFNREVLPLLAEDFIEPGLVRVEIRDYAFLGMESTSAAMAATCAERQDRFWEMHQLLIANQGELHNDESLDEVSARVSEMAEMAGLDVDSWANCMEGGANRVVAESLAEARALGINSTPSIIVNGERIDWDGWPALKADLPAIVAAAAEGTPAAAGTPTIPPGGMTEAFATMMAGGTVDSRATPRPGGDPGDPCAGRPDYLVGEAAVTVEDVYLRDEPSLDGSRDRVLARGTRVTVTGGRVETGLCDWWPVSVDSTGEAGFILEPYIQPER